MRRLAIIGAGISGLTAAQCLKNNYDLTVYEKEDSPGGLIRCKSFMGGVFHLCGGHVFNSKDQDVLEWFWHFFDRKTDFHLADRNSNIFFDDNFNVPYPVENNIFLFDAKIQSAIIKDWISINANHKSCDNFQDFLINTFGKTLYDIYFKGYNEKIWKCDLKDIPIQWLDGKLPVSFPVEMILNNINRFKETKFVHSSFYYPNNRGSQFIADKFAEGINVKYNTHVNHIMYNGKKWYVNNEEYDKVIFCGNIKDLNGLLEGIELDQYNGFIKSLMYHGTTTVFVEIDKNPYTWIYLPNVDVIAHRIICTGNFSTTNNCHGISMDRITATIEFTNEIDKREIMLNLTKLPYYPKYLCHNYNKYTYPIQTFETRNVVSELKSWLEGFGFYMTGRFADWEYYNMDMAIKAAMKTSIKLRNV